MRGTPIVVQPKGTEKKSVFVFLPLSRFYKVYELDFPNKINEAGLGSGESMSNTTQM